MLDLERRRSVFHSEADFQFAFGQCLTTIDPSIDVRLERPVRVAAGATYVDMVCLGPLGITMIEFKYFTRGWQSEKEVDGEFFQLRNHAARDLGRKGFIRDIARLERLRDSMMCTGLAIMLTNDPALWRVPEVSPATRDRRFRIHEGARLSGTLAWADQLEHPSSLTLDGSYELRWSDFSRLGNPATELRYLAVEVA